MDMKSNVYDERMGSGYGTVKSLFVKFGAEEIIEQIQFNPDQAIFNKA